MNANKTTIYTAKTKRACCITCKDHIADGEEVYVYTVSASGRDAKRYEHIGCHCENHGNAESHTDKARGNQASHGLMFEFRVTVSDKMDTAKLQHEFADNGFESTDYGYHSELIGDLRMNQALVTFLESIARRNTFVGIGVTVHGMFDATEVEWLKRNGLFATIHGVSVTVEENNTVTFKAGVNGFTGIRRLYLTARNYSRCYAQKLSKWGMSDKTKYQIVNVWSEKMMVKTEKDLAKAKSYKA